MATKTLIIGAGRSSLGAAKLLTKLNKQILVSDISEKYPEQIAAMRKAGFPIVIGPQTENLLEDTDEIIVSPGLPAEVPILRAAAERKIRVRSEIDLALSHFSGPVVGITGTNGKSTTTMLTAHILEGLGIGAVASGNIGVPPSFVLADDVRVETFVLELSSYQLDFSSAIKNHCSVFTSFSEDHLERHKDLYSYFAAKWRLVLATERNGLCVMPRSVLATAMQFKMPLPRATIVQVLVDKEPAVRWPGPCLKVYFDSAKNEIKGDGINGVRQVPEDLSFHNKLNLIYSIIAVQTLQKTHWNRCVGTISNFGWLPYRFQKIGTWMGFPIFNDSKSTNVESTMVALESIKDPCILLLGGHPKGESFRALTKYKRKIGTLLAFGAASAKIAEDLGSLNPHQFSTLKDALVALPRFFERLPGPVVFSPACSSFDEFRNFEERGEYFNSVLNSVCFPSNFS